MPYLNLKTNKEIADKDDLLKGISALIAEELGKPENYVMASIETGLEMIMGGNDDPVVFVELKSIGLSESATAGLSSAICGFLEDELEVSGNRVYINFIDIPGKRWGWNGSTF